MKTSVLRSLSLAAVAALVLAACSSSTTSTWTIAPAQPTPSAAPSVPSSAAPSAPAMSMTPASPAASSSNGSPVPGGSPGTSTAPGASPAASAAAGQTIKLELTGSLSITQDGQQVTELTVHEGETVHFVVDNTAGFPHNFHIGTADQLSQGASGLPGIPDWSSGVQEFDYQVTADTANLEFGCTVPGHYQLMHGTFKVVP